MFLPPRPKFNHFKLLSAIVLSSFISTALTFGNAYSYSGISGAAGSLKNQQIAASASPSSNHKSGHVTCHSLNVRSGPGTNYPIIGGLSSGDNVTIIENVNGWYKIKYNGGTAYVSDNYISIGSKSSDSDSNEDGTVTAQPRLNVRSGPWGSVIGKLDHCASVNIIGKSGDWYKIKYNGKTAYVHSDYINKGGSGQAHGSPSPSRDNSSNSSSKGGSLQKSIVNAAKNLVGSTNFRDSDVAGGNLACAKVASTILKNAGAVSSVVLNVHGVINLLHNKGWKEVSAPPFHPGDVITWKTYDRNHDGRKDADTHVGIIENGTTCIANSSSRRMPSRCNVYFAPISRVLRKV
ncbi:MAG: SH3 domain-containing protein [Candidatus Wallbacteria bacterium]